MKFYYSLLTLFIIVGTLSLSSCGEADSSDSQGNNSTTENPEGNKSDTDLSHDQTPKRAEDFDREELKAKFVEFELGDASHYIFEDEYGKVWDFAGCEGTHCDFAMELPAEEANETNQGWSSNSKLQGKWFNLKYYATEREMYIDGPVGTVHILSEAQIAE